MRVTTLALIVGLLVAVDPSPVRADPEMEKAATSAALAWLALIEPR